MDKLLALLLATTFFMPVRGQNPQSSDKTKNNMMIGINGADLVAKDQLLIPSLVADWNFSENRHLRLQLGYDVNSRTMDYNAQSIMPFNNFEVDSVLENAPFQSWESSIRTAYFVTRPINAKVNFYYGVELIYRFQKISFETDYSIVQDFGGSNRTFIDVNEKETVNVHGYGIAPLAGVQWQLSPGIQIGFETQAAFEVSERKSEYFMHMIQTTAFSPDEFEQNAHRIKSNTDALSRLLPISGIYVMIQL